MSTERFGSVGSQVPVVDVFAGPGGLGEGFSALEGNRFRIAISIEMERTAHKTLQLRSFFRQFPKGHAPSEYYDYVRGISHSMNFKLLIPVNGSKRKGNRGKLNSVPKTTSRYGCGWTKPSKQIAMQEMPYC